jgi:subtilisin family serine protease
MNYPSSASKFLVKICIFLLMALPPVLLFAQENRQVRRGERPEIPIKSMSDDAIHPGYFRVKIHEKYSEKMATKSFAENVSKNQLTGIKSFDELNAKNNIKSIKQSFHSRAFGHQFSERHQQWGFHLWITIEVGEAENIFSLVHEYNKLDEVFHAEPVYQIEWIKAEFISDEGDAIMPQGVIGKTNADSLPDDPRFEDQWHFHNTGQTGGTPGADISLLEAWRYTRGNPDVIVAVIDGGMHYDHPDLIDNMWEGIGYNFVSDTSLIFMTRHGTHVGGTIGAKSNNAIGVAGVAGGWESEGGVKLMTCQVFEPVSMGENIDAFHLAPVWAADHGAAISQNSWGYTRPNVYNQIELDAIDYFNVNGGGDVMFGGVTLSSAGNSNSHERYYPASYSEVISIAATNHKDMKAGYSNYGVHVDVSAPGGDDTNVDTRQGVLSTVEYSYGYAQGTSMACPHVSGVVALMLSAAPAEYTTAQLKSLLLQSVDDITASNPDYIGKLGSGRINAYLAVKNALANKRAPIHFEARQEDNYNTILSWKLNQFDNPVIVAFNTEPRWGVVPFNAQTGSRIPGGGTVIYAGKGQSFIHKLPAGPKTYYKIWSVDPDRKTVSAGRHASVTKDAVSVNIPYGETFGYHLLPAGWTALTLNSGTGNSGADPALTMTRFSEDPPAQPTTGNFMISFNSHDARHGSQIQLVSPAFSTIGLNQVSFSFDWHYHNHQQQANDRVQISVSRNQETWTNIGLLTRFGSETGWKRENIALPSFFNNREEVYIRFVFVAERVGENRGGNMYFDNFSIQTTSEQIIADFSVSDAQPVTGQRVIFYNRSAGNNIETIQWDFGTDAFPRIAMGAGPHEVRYGTAGLKNPAIVLNNDILYEKQGYISVSSSGMDAPANFTGQFVNASDTRLDWTFSAGNRKVQADTGQKNENIIHAGFNIYRNGRFLENIKDPEARSFTNRNVPSGYHDYFVTAFFEEADKESAPTPVVRLISNGQAVSIRSLGDGSTFPPSGSHLFLLNDTATIYAFAGENQAIARWIVNGQVQPATNPLKWVITGETEIEAVFEVGTGIADTDPEFARLLVYPNPAGSVVTVELQHATAIKSIQLLDVRGTVIRTVQVRNESGPLRETISLEGINPGVYLLRIQGPDDQLIRKLIIQ